MKPASWLQILIHFMTHSDEQISNFSKVWHDNSKLYLAIGHTLKYYDIKTHV